MSNLFQHLLNKIGLPFNDIDNKKFWEFTEIISKKNETHRNSVKYNDHIDAYSSRPE